MDWIGVWHMFLGASWQWQAVVGAFVLYCLAVLLGALSGVDGRSDGQKLMDTRIGDRVTSVGSVLDAVNAQARGRDSKTSF